MFWFPPKVSTNSLFNSISYSLCCLCECEHEWSAVWLPSIYMFSLHMWLSCSWIWQKINNVLNVGVWVCCCNQSNQCTCLLLDWIVILTRCSCLHTVAELWLSTSWCTTAAETSRLSRDSSGCPVPSRVSTARRRAPLPSTPQRSRIWLWILPPRAPSRPRCKASWKTSLTPTWCKSERPDSKL